MVRQIRLEIQTEHRARQLIVLAHDGSCRAVVEPDEVSMPVRHVRRLAGMDLYSVAPDAQVGVVSPRLVLVGRDNATDCGPSDYWPDECIDAIATLLQSTPPAAVKGPDRGRSDAIGASISSVPSGRLRVAVSPADLHPAHPFVTLGRGLRDVVARNGSALQVGAADLRQQVCEAVRAEVTSVEISWLEGQAMDEIRPEEARILRRELAPVASLVLSLVRKTQEVELDADPTP